jgi:thermitase
MAATKGLRSSLFSFFVVVSACQSPTALDTAKPVSTALSISPTAAPGETQAGTGDASGTVPGGGAGTGTSAAAAAPIEQALEAEWRFNGASRQQLMGSNDTFKGYLQLSSQNRFLDPAQGLTYRVGEVPWQDDTGKPIDGPRQLSQQWTVAVYEVQDGQRFGFPLAQTHYEGDFSEIHWNGITDTGERAPQRTYEIVATPEGLSLKPISDPLQLLNSPVPHSELAPPPDYATDHLLARFRDQNKAGQQYTLITTDASGISQIQVPQSTTAEARAEALLTLAQRLQSDPNVVFAEPDLFYGIDWVPNDPRLSEQYALGRVQAEAAWDIEKGNNSVVVAIVDTGIDTDHPDLKPQLVAGWNVIANNNAVRDDNGHGTHCAGITAAAGNNGEGISGLAPNVKIMPIKVMNASGQGNSLDIATGIRWAADHGAHVISLSLGTSMGSTVIREALVYAVGKGVTLVAAMGNDGGQVRNYPATYAAEIDGLVAVGATDSSDARAYFSNYGSWITVTAPGYQILSTLPRYAVEANRSGQAYGPLSGTSMATPYVAGLAGLLKSQQLNRGPTDIKAAIIQGADDLGSSGFDTQFGYGRINAARSLGLNLPVAVPTPTPIPTPTPVATPSSPAGSGSGVPGGLILDIN